MKMLAEFLPFGLVGCCLYNMLNYCMSHVIVPLLIQSVQQAVGVVRLTDLHIKVKPFMLCLDWWRDGGKYKIPLV
jgi:hypothetical protein